MPTGRLRRATVGCAQHIGQGKIRRRRHTATKVLIGVAAFGVVAGGQMALAGHVGAVTRPAVHSGAREGFPVPKLRWDKSCTHGGGEFQCDTARVPLDYDRPKGPTISLALIRRPATDRKNRIGTLFFNSGGPGNALTTYLPALYQRLPEQVRQRFDIVGFDPRGIGESTSVQCFQNAAEEGSLLSKLPPGFPIGPSEETQTLDVFDHFTNACASGDTRLLSHVSTANTARDMDLLRRAVGDRKLSYYGLSYGTLIGATYANLFPGSIRAMVLDSVLEPVAYTTGRGDEAERLGTALRVGDDVSRLATLHAFLDLCGRAGVDRCPFSAGTARATHAKYDALLDVLRGRPITLGETTFTYASAVAAVTATLEATTAIPDAVDAGWPQGAALLQALWDQPLHRQQSQPRCRSIRDRG
jgi:pimeloyl-ACP methyl ester carboxylesterase